MSPFQRALVALLALALLATYLPAFEIHPYTDDLLRIANAQVHGFDLQYEFYKYRPLERLITAANVSLFGTKTHLAVAASLFGLFAACLAVWRIARQLRPESRVYPLAATVFFAFHSLNASAVFQIDTLSQQLASVFSLWAFYWYLLRTDSPAWTYHAWGSALLFLVLASKEVALGAVLSIPVAAHFWRSADLPRSGRDLILGLAGALLASVVFGVLWHATGGLNIETAQADYRLHFSPAQPIRNLAMLFGSILYIGSTLDIFASFSLPRVLFSGIASTLFLLLCAGGFLSALKNPSRSPGRDRAALIALAIVTAGAALPFCLPKTVSELYTYLLTPFVALGCSFFIEEGLRRGLSLFRAPPQLFRPVGTALLLGYACWMSFGTLGKLSLAKAVGLRSENYLEQINRWQATLDPGEFRVCMTGNYQDNHTRHHDYSVFVVPDRALLERILTEYSSLTDRRRNYVIASEEGGICDYQMQVSDGDLSFHARL